MESGGTRKRKGTENRICYDFFGGGNCPRGEKCPFSHEGLSGVQGQNPPQKLPKGVCFEFFRGKCDKGSECRFRHTLEEEIGGEKGEKGGNLPPKGVCFEWYKKGECGKGSECRYSND